MRRALTLIEVLIVVGIIAALLGLMLPAVVRARAAARTTECRNTLKLMGQLHWDHYQTYRRLPRGGWPDVKPGQRPDERWRCPEAEAGGYVWLGPATWQPGGRRAALAADGERRHGGTRNVLWDDGGVEGEK